MSETDVVKPKSEDPIRDIPKVEEQIFDIDEIVVKDNVRVDYGDGTDIVASIMEYGIRQPIEIKRNKELVDGHRRVHWCKKAIDLLIKAGNKEKANEIRKVRFFYNDEKLDKTTSQLIYGIFGKNLNPIEEGKSYKGFIDKKKLSVKTLAAKISKPINYVEKRLIVTDLPEDIQKALVDNKIQLGHALALARLSSEKEMKQKLKRVISDKLSVAGTVDILKNHNTNLKETQFDKTECKKCKFNGSTQGQLFETGTTLKGNCLNEKCFLKKTREYIQQLKKEYKEKGIRILTEEEHENLRHRESFSNYNMPVNDLYKKKCKKGCEKFAVCFSRGYSDEIEVKEICLNPRCFRGVTKQDEDPKQMEKRLLAKAKTRLQGKVMLYKTDFLIDKASELIKPSTKQTKAFVLHTLLAKYDSYNRNKKVEAVLNEIGIKEYYGNKVFSKIMKLDETKIDELTSKIVTLHLPEIPLYELNNASESFGVDLKNYVVITEEYLKPHTKQQLINLAKEIGLHAYLIEKGKAEWANGKKPDLIDTFFKEGFDLKGKIPKVMMENEQ